MRSLKEIMVSNIVFTSLILTAPVEIVRQTVKITKEIMEQQRPKPDTVKTENV